MELQYNIEDSHRPYNKNGSSKFHLIYNKTIDTNNVKAKRTKFIIKYLEMESFHIIKHWSTNPLSFKGENRWVQKGIVIFVN